MLYFTEMVADTQISLRTPHSTFRTHNILGVRVHDCDEEGAVLAIEQFLRERPAHLHQVCTVNPEFVMEARRYPAFRKLLNSADLATPDGIGIIMAGRLLGTPFKGRATGVALVDRLASLSAREGYTLFLLGAGAGVAEEAAQALARRHEGVRIAGTYAGSPREEELPEIVSRLEGVQPDVLLVAYGAPRQDLWINEHCQLFPPSVKVAMGVGGVLDYLSGRVPLAPPLLRRVGLEWLYRLVKQPWRWRRIVRVFAFGMLVLKKKLEVRN
ncbi:MAG TPA: WecB/TagA/CpsF family glycosyltransferase [Chloroflexia bacterium]|nr:WecB/TagA/CpsF family glycosyltransferase [Chloroflexia bacterium]